MRHFVIAAAGLLLLVHGPGLACQASKTSFYDDFSKPDAGWGQQRPYRAFVSHSMRLKPQPGGANYWINKTHAMQNASICMAFQHPKLTSPTKANFGMIIWHEDDDNFAAVEIDGAGIVSVWRQTDKKWAKISDEVVEPSYNKTPGAKNELVVELRNDAGSVSVNGVKVLEFKRQPHKDNWHAGPWAENQTDKLYEFVINNVSMTKTP